MAAVECAGRYAGTVYSKALQLTRRLRGTHKKPAVSKAISNRAVVHLAGVGLCLTFAGCGGNVAPGGPDYPESNPNPTKFLLVHGTIDKALDLKFSIEWQSQNPTCRYAVSRLEGAYASYSAGGPLAVERRGTDFSVRIPIDGVLPGLCQWAFGGVSFAGPTGWWTPLIVTNSYPLEAGQSPNGVAELHCRSVASKGEPPDDKTLSCRWPATEDRAASVRGGVLWWHPEASELEVHFIAG